MQTAATRGRGAAAVALLLLVAFLAQGFGADDAKAAETQRDRMLALINQDRAAHDRAALSLDAGVSRYAKRHSREMATKGYLFHTVDLGAKLSGVDWSIGGENVGAGSSLRRIDDAFMRSKEHRRNILRSGFDHSAIGVYRGADGRIWVTIIFYG
jgi:uncharacterized protein YkwD